MARRPTSTALYAAIPPDTPSRIRATLTASLAVAVLDLAPGDLLEGDLEVVLRARLHHRRRVLVEGALAEVVVVGVDLPGPLGGDEDAGVVGVHLVEQHVETWLDHGEDMVAASSVSSCRARPRSSFTTRWSNSPAASNSSRAAAKRRSITSGRSDARAARRRFRSSNEGGSMKMRTASGRRSR